MLITFIPTRLVTGGDGKLEIGLQQYDSHDQAEGKEHKALSGYTEHTAYRIERHSICRTLPVRLTRAQLDQWREFAASCAFGEFFTFDALGTEAAPDNPQTVQLKFKSFKEKRLPGQLFEFGFTTIQVIA
ncbi:hypothetical protein [Microbulbifer spongiae]|uniref:Phage tail protein n=1 Tax=Microbulbifer spongiae TaxID=2944933 RepID=A0ABY9E7V0_9GAMM|nr:hypothetical protein [Microbulbifer sp. MI-G]WKD48401.1 hypothetical protein M8T91_10705 [Microbulbifer sp. MI-G]